MALNLLFVNIHMTGLNLYFFILLSSIHFWGVSSLAQAQQGGLTHYEILKDPENRIQQEFKMNTALKWRTQFWFDIYTRYTDKDHVLHHARYPWIIFEVVNTDAIFKKKLNFFTKHYRANKLVASRRATIINTLKKLSKRKSYKNLIGLEKKLYKTLKYVRGQRSKVFKEAYKNLRKQLGQKTFFETGLANSTKYLSHMEEEFERQGLPRELTRLPFVESSFNEKAQSKVGASGIWQIMPLTGRSYMKVTRYIDERNSPLKATLMAAKELKRNYKILNSWPLAITAYNHGVGSVKRAIRHVKSDNFVKILNGYSDDSFGFASKNFYPSFVAALHAQMYHNQIFTDIDFRSPLKFQMVRLDKSTRVKEFLKKFNVAKEDLLNFNLDLKKAIQHNIALPKGLTIYLPITYNVSKNDKESKSI